MKKVPQIKQNGKIARKWGAKEGDKLLIPSPSEVNEIMKKVTERKLITINEIRAILVKKHNATITRQLTTGIFARISAEAEGARREEMYPVERNSKKLLEGEGHKI
ncbi:MAG: hypothetical protein H5T44_00145 [Thermoplasmatales archaeon]|nr:hypothetical protein [Thermoplasmatales archaeon]